MGARKKFVINLPNVGCRSACDILVSSSPAVEALVGIVVLGERLGTRPMARDPRLRQRRDQQKRG
jgi:hypothetical protein